MFVFHLEADLEPRTAAAGMARDSALSALSTLPDVVACVASPRTDAGKKISCGRHDAQERQRHKAADGEQRHQIVVPGGGQVLDDFEEVEHGLDGVCDVFHVPPQSHGGLGRDDVLRPDTSGTLPHTDASARRRRGRTRPVNPQACRKVYAVLDLLRERFTVEWDPESKGYRKAIRRPR